MIEVELNWAGVILLLIIILFSAGCDTMEYEEVDAHPDQLAVEYAFADWYGEHVDPSLVVWVKDNTLVYDGKQWGGRMFEGCEIYVEYHEDITAGGYPHELLHCLLEQRHDDPDPRHSRQEWADVGVDENGTHPRWDAPLNSFIRERI